MDNKLHNILYFTIIFLSGDLNLMHTSPDYFLEKFKFYFGDIDIKKNEKSSIFIQYDKIWKSNDYRINSIFLFLDNVLNYNYNNRNKEIDPFGEEDWNELDGISQDSAIKNIARTPDDYYYLFDEYLGNVNDIIDEKKGGLHFILKKHMFDVYKKMMI